MSPTLARFCSAKAAAARQFSVLMRAISRAVSGPSEADGAPSVWRAWLKASHTNTAAITSSALPRPIIAIAPAHQGKGLGRCLLEYAESEARRQGFDSIYLYAQEIMTENLALYRRIGYVEYDRRVELGLHRVYLRKPL